MRLKRILSAVSASVVAVSVMASNIIVASAKDDYVLINEDTTNSNFKQVYTLKESDDLKTLIEKDCTVVVEYTGGEVEVILQSWNDPNGAVWAQVKPDTDSDGVATFSYDSMKKAFIDDKNSDWEYFDAFLIGVGEEETTVHKAYIKYSDGNKGNTNSKGSTIPTISFDTKAWTNYVKATPDSSLIGLKLDQFTTDSYQATSLVVSADFSGDLAGRWPTYAGVLLDADGKHVYPDAPNIEKKDTDLSAIARMGIEINAKDYGLENFNDCFITFYYNFNETAYEGLLNNGMYIYGTDDSYEGTSLPPKIIKVDPITRENIDFYKKGFINIAGLKEDDPDVTKIIIELPLMKGYKGELLRMDNIQIALADETVIANVDGYNSTFKPRNESDGKLKPGVAQTIEQEDEIIKKPIKQNNKDTISPITIIVFVAVGVVIIGLIVFVIIKNKNRYY